MSFNLPEFLPYVLNQSGEAVSKGFQNYYRDKYGMLRTEWRVLFHLGCYDDMTAKRICQLGSFHKTKVSRAVNALEKKRYLKRVTDESDRRIEHLQLTSNGLKVYNDLREAAADYQAKITKKLSKSELAQLQRILAKLSTDNLDAVH